jgi:hypothetical protein
MPDLYRVRVESINVQRLTCQVTELYGDGYHLVTSRTLALGFLWDTVGWLWWIQHAPAAAELENHQAQALAESTSLGQALAGFQYYSDRPARAVADRIISCVGVTERRTVITGDREWSHYEDGTEIPQATYNIAVTDPHWLEHLAPGMVWESRAWDRDRSTLCRPEWRTSDVMLVATRIEESQDFSGLPILADALQEAECDSDDLLKHLRDPQAAHVRGCWALDLVLGKE